MKHLDGATRKLTKFAASPRRRRLLIVAAALAPAAVASGSPALAACLQSGSTVTCSGASNTGFGNGTQNNLTLTVQSGASITVGAAKNAIHLGTGNTATNDGALIGNNSDFGMRGQGNNVFINNGSISGFGNGMAAYGNNNNFTNAGTIAVATNGTGIYVNGAGSTVLNSGTIDMSGGSATGILSSSNSSGSTITNSGTILMGGTFSSAITIATLSGGTALNSGIISLGGSNSLGMRGIGNSVLTNTGTITIGSSSTGMYASGNNNALSNAGAISSTAPNSTGIHLLGDGNTVTNSGAITLAGTFSNGIAAIGIGNAIQNSGIITVGSGGANATGVVLQTNNTLANTGTIAAVGVNGVGVGFWGNGNTVTNSGLISATGSGGIAISLIGTNNTVVNNGTIRSGPSGYTLYTGGMVSNSITNNGTLDGRMSIGGLGSSLTNAGLMTITDAGTPLTASDMFFRGTFTQTAQGTLSLRVDSAGLHDGLFVQGQAGINGTLRAVVRPGLYGTTTTYTDAVVGTVSVNGQFANVTSSSVFFSAAATHNAASVDLTLTRLGFGSVSGATSNQRAIGNALEAGYSTALTGTAAAIYGNLLTAGSLRVLDLLSGEGTSGTQNTAFAAAGLFGQTMDSRMTAWLAGNRGGVTDGAALGYAAERRDDPAQAFAALKAPAMAQPRWNAWAAGFGSGQSLAGNASVGFASFSDRAAGGSMGVDHLVNPDLLVGIAAGGSSATFSVNDRATSGRLEGGHLGAYATQRFGAGYLSAQVAFSHFNNTTTRMISGVGPDEIARGTFGSNQLGARLEVGRAFDFGPVVVTPFAAVQAARLWQGAYSETSTAGAAPGLLGLSYTAREVSSLPIFVGAKFDGRAYFGNGMIWTPFVHAAWVHEFEPSRGITASLTGVPTMPAFSVEGARAASDAARLDLGSRLALNRRTELSARVTGEFSNLGQSYSGMGSLRVNW